MAERKNKTHLDLQVVMLSVCLPVYNVDVTHLVKKIIEQGNRLSIALEVLVYDDGSTPLFKETNASLKQYKEVIYYELPNNLGSAAIRNKMAGDAQFNSLLFLDSDSEIPDNYLNAYLPFLDNDKMIVCGGRIHPKALPSPDKSLRWKVGKVKEDHNAKKRRTVPNKSFMSNNFLAKKELFAKISFDDTIERSGHEDTMFGIELEKMGIEIEHIDNPVVHIGLEGNEEFIIKTEQRLETLQLIENKYKNNNLLYRRITILKYFRWIKWFKLITMTHWLFKLFKNNLKNQLVLKDPNMVFYDCYKLGYYAELYKTKN